MVNFGEIGPFLEQSGIFMYSGSITFCEETPSIIEVFKDLPIECSGCF